MSAPAIIYVWTGESMLPTLHYARLAERTFTSGQAYRLIVAEEKEQERKKTRRTAEQNSKLWAMLSEIAEQYEHNGRRYTADQWKVLLLDLLGHERQLLPSLRADGTVVPYGGRSSHMTVAQMAEFLEFVYVWGLECGVKFATDKGVMW